MAGIEEDQGSNRLITCASFKEHAIRFNTNKKVKKVLSCQFQKNGFLESDEIKEGPIIR